MCLSSASSMGMVELRWLSSRRSCFLGFLPVVWRGIAMLKRRFASLLSSLTRRSGDRQARLCKVLTPSAVQRTWWLPYDELAVCDSCVPIAVTAGQSSPVVAWRWSYRKTTDHKIRMRSDVSKPLAVLSLCTTVPVALTAHWQSAAHWATSGSRLGLTYLLTDRRSLQCLI